MILTRWPTTIGRSQLLQQNRHSTDMKGRAELNGEALSAEQANYREIAEISGSPTGELRNIITLVALGGLPTLTKLCAVAPDNLLCSAAIAPHIFSHPRRSKLAPDKELSCH